MGPTRHNKDAAWHAGQHVASGQKVHESGSAGALFVQLRLARVCDDSERGFVCASREQVTKRIECFHVVALFVVARRCVPRVKNHALRFEAVQRRADVFLEFRVGESQSKRWRLTDSNPVLDFITIERGKFLL
jgi:hypothetical protein